MAITPNPVTAFRKSGKTPPTPPKLEDYYTKLYGSAAPVSGGKFEKPKTSTVEEELKLNKAALTVLEESIVLLI